MTNPRAGVQRKVRFAGYGALGSVGVLVLVNILLKTLGYEPIGEDEWTALVDGGTILVTGLVALVQWIIAYRTHPAPEDRPVPESTISV